MASVAPLHATTSWWPPQLSAPIKAAVSYVLCGCTHRNPSDHSAAPPSPAPRTSTATGAPSRARTGACPAGPPAWPPRRMPAEHEGRRPPARRPRRRRRPTTRAGARAEPPRVEPESFPAPKLFCTHRASRAHTHTHTHTHTEPGVPGSRRWRPRASLRERVLPSLALRPGAAADRAGAATGRREEAARADRRVLRGEPAALPELDVLARLVVHERVHDARPRAGTRKAPRSPWRTPTPRRTTTRRALTTTRRTRRTP